MSKRKPTGPYTDQRAVFSSTPTGRSDREREDKEAIPPMKHPKSTPKYVLGAAYGLKSKEAHEGRNDGAGMISKEKRWRCPDCGGVVGSHNSAQCRRCGGTGEPEYR